MSTKPAFVLAALVLVSLCGAAGFVGAHLALPVDAPGPPRAAPDADLRAQAEETDRRLANVERGLRGVEERVGALEDAVEALRQRVPPLVVPRSGGDPHADAAGAAAPGAGVGVGPEGVREKTDEELQAAREQQLKAAWSKAAQTFVPARLLALADDGPDAGTKRRMAADREAREMAAALNLKGDQFDTLLRLYTDHIDRLAREVGPLVKGGLDGADLAAVQKKLDEAWAELDRGAQGALDAATFERYRSEAADMRGYFRDVLAARAAKKDE